MRFFSLLLFVFFLEALFAFTIHAQQSSRDPVTIAFENRINGAIRLMSARVDTENNELNSRLSVLNASAPLEKAHLDSASVVANVSRIFAFIDYLKYAHKFSDTLAHQFEDSLYIIGKQLPENINPSEINEMDAAFREDRNAYNTFLDALNQLYSDVLDVLTFLQRTPYSLAHEKFTFMSRTDQTEYQKRMKIVDADVKSLNESNENMRQATKKANERIQAAPEKTESY